MSEPYTLEMCTYGIVYLEGFICGLFARHHACILWQHALNEAILQYSGPKEYIITLCTVATEIHSNLAPDMNAQQENLPHKIPVTKNR